MLLVVFIVAVDIAGFNFRHRPLARSYTLSLATLILLPLLYVGVSSLLRHRRRGGTVTPAEAPGGWRAGS